MGGKVIEITSSSDWQKRHSEAKAAGKAVNMFASLPSLPFGSAAHAADSSRSFLASLFSAAPGADRLHRNMDISMQNGVSAMPTFHGYNKEGQRVTEVRGGNVKALQDFCERNKSASFQGAGQTLGGSSSATASSPTQAPGVKQASTGVSDGQPATSLQIRLADGSKLTGRFNLSQTIQDVKKFIDSSSSPGFAYKLTTSYPRKELTDLSQTLQAADVSETVLTVQRA